MASALMKPTPHAGTVKLDITDALSAAISRAAEVGCPKKTLVSMISKAEWASMDATAENILVFDPE